MNTQVSILLYPSDLDGGLREGMAMSTQKFVSSTLVRICQHDHISYAQDFSNLCTVMNSFPSSVGSYVRLLARSLDDTYFCLLVGIMRHGKLDSQHGREIPQNCCWSSQCSDGI
jgi:hypothetical protein